MVVVKEHVANFTSEDLNNEFGSTTFDLSVGDIIAIDDTLVKYIEYNNQSFDSLVKTSVDKNLEDPFSYVIEPTPSVISMNLELKCISYIGSYNRRNTKAFWECHYLKMFCTWLLKIL